MSHVILFKLNKNPANANLFVQNLWLNPTRHFTEHTEYGGEQELESLEEPTFQWDSWANYKETKLDKCKYDKWYETENSRTYQGGNI